MPEFETVIGLEVHLQLSTETKIFCGCANLFGQEPNTLTCPVCLGLPGSLPVLNKKALMYAIKAALAINCQINSVIKFDRKNYYYPDLPKGYQISQHDAPVAHNGWVMIPLNGSLKKIPIKRAHLEEDAGKLIHDASLNGSLVDYNRTGTPLMEIVSEPDLRSPQEAYDYLTTLKLILQYLNVSDCDMEKGSLRCDANISLREKGDLIDGCSSNIQTNQKTTVDLPAGKAGILASLVHVSSEKASKLGTKTELKNMNSFRAVKAALEFEENRHRKLLSSGQKIIQETRLWNDEKALTISMRSKEDAHDYRYFPEPDLVPFIIEEAALKEIKSSLPELPREKFERFLNNYKLSPYDAQILIQDQELAHFFEQCATFTPEIKKVCNWLIGPILQEWNARGGKVNALSLQPQELCDLIKKVEDGTLSNLAAKEVLKIKLDTHQSIDTIITEQGWTQVSDDGTLEKCIEEILTEHPQVVEQIRQGKESALGFLVGQAMKKTRGKANPKKMKELIKRRFHNV